MNNNKINLQIPEGKIRLSNIYMGNKIIKLKHTKRDQIESYPYYDITLNKELFAKQEDNTYQSLSDFSNFQMLHQPKENKQQLAQSFQKLELFTPLEEGEYYATHLQPLWKFIYMDSSEEEIKHFMKVYNKKLMQQASKELRVEHSIITDWWYTGLDYQQEEDTIEIVSTKEENLLSVLGTLKGPVKCYQKTILKK